MAHHPKKDFRLLIMVSVYKNRGTKLFRNIKDNRKQENLSRKSCLLRDEYNRKTAFQLFLHNGIRIIFSHRGYQLQHLVPNTDIDHSGRAGEYPRGRCPR